MKMRESCIIDISSVSHQPHFSAICSALFLGPSGGPLGTLLIFVFIISPVVTVDSVNDMKEPLCTLLIPLALKSPSWKHTVLQEKLTHSISLVFFFIFFPFVFVER
uniref:Uncharacterized protein n=1 Tax=Rhizophora mucronata TaxID=61149 RepID=A0A2P2QYQ1_RHIMU